MRTCQNCKYSRQRCKMDDQDLVGCALVCPEEVMNKEVRILGEGDIYRGWFYNNRRVGDVAERSDIGSGAMVNGMLLFYAQCCSKWEEREC